MGNTRKILSAIGLGILAVIAVVFLIANFMGKDNFQIEPENISVFDEDHSEYYLKQAPKDLGFQVFLTESTEELEFKLTDEAGNEVDARVKKKKDNTYEIRAPRSGYHEGERYRIELGEGALFANEELLHAESLVFAIERSPIEHYKFTDQVIELDQQILQVSPDIIEVENVDLNEGDIIFGLNEDDEYIAYKISEVINENRVQVTIPAIDEIYSELEVYGEYEFDFNEIVSNPDIETKLVNNIKNSHFFTSLLTTAYGEAKDAGEVDIYLEYEPNPKTNTLQFKLVITLKAGKDGLFAKESLKHHEVKITLVSEFGTSAVVDIDSVRNWDVSASRSEGFAWEVDITYKPPKIDQSSKLSDLFKQDNEEDVLEITRLLNEMVSDEMKNEITLFEHGIPISGIPGLVLSFEVNIVLSLELQANLNFKNDYSTVTTVGLMYRNSEFKPYFNNNYDTSGGEASIKGELNSKAGLNFEIKTKLIHDKVAYISLKPEVGLYADAYVAITINSLRLDRDNTYGYFESGTYFNAEVQGHVNTLIKQYDYNNEIAEVRKRFEKLSFGDYKIVAGLNTENLTIYVKDFLASPPHFTFNYYDIRSETEENKVLNASDLSYFLADGTEVELKDDKLVIPKTDEEEIILIVEYKDNNRVYSKDLTLYISENRKDGFIDHDQFEDPLELVFSSGVGAWGTVIELSSDGSFTGVYQDANAGMYGNGYMSTNYISVFTGWFGEIERIDEDTYSMKLLDINYEYEENEEWIEDNIKYIASEPYGLEEGKNFFLYSPEKHIQDLSDDFLSWGMIMRNDSDPEQKLLHWALHNEKTDYGFYSERYMDDVEREAEVPVSNPTNRIPTNFDHIEFDNNYSGPGSEFIGTWHQVNFSTVDFAPNPWNINYKDGIFYIRANLPGDPAIIIMTAEYKDGKLYSHNGTQINFLDYENTNTLEIELPNTVEMGNEKSQFFFENGYLQWNSEITGDVRDIPGTVGGFEGYEKR